MKDSLKSVCVKELYSKILNHFEMPFKPPIEWFANAQEGNVVMLMGSATYVLGRIFVTRSILRSSWAISLGRLG